MVDAANDGLGMVMKIVPLILSGGSGERLWPLSKSDYPKQYVSFNGGRTSLFQETILRVMNREIFAPPLVVCNQEHRFIVAEQLRQIEVEDAQFLLEPVGRNTAAAFACAALSFAEDTLLLALPSDHLILRPERWLEAVRLAAPVADDGFFVTFGITPERAETGYGYIQCGAALDSHREVHAITRFVEKPDAKTAASYLASGEYVWNSGMFLAKNKTVLTEMAASAPEVLAACTLAYAERQRDGIFTVLQKEAFVACPSVSIDYAVMEHTQKGAVLPVDIGWSDLGAWTALHDISPQDEHGNSTVGYVVLEDVKNSYIHTHEPLVAMIGVEDIIVIAADNAVLIGHKDRMQDIKKLTTQMRERLLPDVNLTSFAHRPWGTFYHVDRGSDYQVKRLILKPGSKISLQMHRHRSEHWVVVKGTATVTQGELLFELLENQSTYIAAGTIHRLENKGVDDLIVIEVQTGGYLGEDDIVRYEDVYRREKIQ